MRSKVLYEPTAEKTYGEPHENLSAHRRLFLICCNWEFCTWLIVSLQCTEYPPCSAGFRKRGPLRRHIRSAHLNALPWACRLQDIDDPDKPCTAAFDTRGKLGGHIDMVHKRLLPALYTCAMCIVLETDKKETQQVPEIAGPEGFIGREVEASTDHEEGGDDPANSSPDSTHDFDSAASTPFPIIRSVLVDDSANRPTPDPETAILQGKMGFKTFRELRRHTIEMHPPTCKQCGYTCKNGRNLKIHIKNSHGAGVDERRTFPCQLCDSRFTKVRISGPSFAPSFLLTQRSPFPETRPQGPRQPCPRAAPALRMHPRSLY